MSNITPTPTKKWGEEEKQNWLNQQQIKRLYSEEVLTKFELLESKFIMTKYGELDYFGKKYPLYAFQTKNWSADKKTVLVTGGVHGYETSGVHGAIRFLETKALEYADKFNIVVLPCISPWGYETINRWNPNAIDPNRSFYENSPALESKLTFEYVKSLNTKIYMHIDLHETTDTDNTIFRPALAARDGVENKDGEIPDGFYNVADAESIQIDFQKAVIDSVRKLTHIAPADKDGNIIGSKVITDGVIAYEKKSLGLCGGFSDAEYRTTTEVYPDSQKTNPEECIQAQVLAITGGLDYLLSLR